MKRMFAAVPVFLLLTGGTALFSQVTPAPDTESTRARADSKPDVTFGRIKEMTTGQKVVVDIDNAPDKSFDLTDKDLKVTLAKNLKVGDPVKVTEHEVLGKTKSVSIVKHSGGGVAHGDSDPAAKKP